MNYEFFSNLTLQQKLQVSKDKIEGLPYGYSKQTKIQQPQRDHSPDRFVEEDKTEVVDSLELFKVCLGPQNVNQRNVVMKEPLWPKKPKQFKQSLSTFHYSCQRLSRDLLSLMAIELNLPRDYFNPLLVGHMSVSSLVNYPPIPKHISDQHNIRLGAHTDFGVLTILKDDGIQGLQIQMDPNNSVEWTSVSIPEDCVCVNIGDEMQILTNYIWRSTMHRVVNVKEQSEPRKSVVYFQQLNPRTVIKALPTCVSKERPDSGVSFISEEFLEKRLNSIY